MRLLQVRKRRTFGEDGQLLRSVLIVEFSTGGIVAKLEFEPPGNWDSLSRAQRVAWVKQQLTNHLISYTYEPSDEVIFPDETAKETAANEFENLPGWATWSALEAENWVETNVTSLATAKTALKAMAKAIVFLRDRVIER